MRNKKPILYLSKEETDWGIAVYQDGNVCLVNTENLSKEDLEKRFEVEINDEKFNELFKAYFLIQTG